MAIVRFVIEIERLGEPIGKEDEFIVARSAAWIADGSLSAAAVASSSRSAAPATTSPGTSSRIESA
jgi:hypothetical protein